MHINKVTPHTNLRNLPRPIRLEVQQGITPRRNALKLPFHLFKPSNSENKLMRLSRPTIYDQHSLIRVLMPRKHLRSRIHQRRATNIIITNMDLRISTIQRQRRPIHLRDRDIPKRRSLKFELITRRLARIILRMPEEVEPSLSLKGRCHSQITRTRPSGIRRIPACSSQVRWTYFEKVGLDFLLRVFLAIDASVFSNRRSIVVRCVAAWMA